MQTIEEAFRRNVCDSISLIRQGRERYRVQTPFIFDDGDCLVIVLKKEGDHWILSDEGHTFMHLSYGLRLEDLESGTRSKIISNTLTAFSITDRDGELIMSIPDEDYGHCLYDFIQVLLKISDISYLSRETVKSTFMDDFRIFIREKVPTNRFTFDWHDPEHDKKAKYTVDCHLNGTTKPPLLLFAMLNDAQVRDATIILHQFERWHVQPPNSAGIFEDQEHINRKVLARFSDICGKQFSSLSTNKEGINAFLQRALEPTVGR